MDETETGSNHGDTPSVKELLAEMEARLTARINHLDEGIHELDRKGAQNGAAIAEIHAVVIEHKPLLEAFTGAGVRKFLGVGKKANGGR